MPINKQFINDILQHVVDITNDECTIEESLILEKFNEDVTKAELLSGLLFLHETIQFQKSKLIKTNIELNKKNDDLEEFAYITSHDLKAPLRGIYALASFIEEDISNNKVNAVYDSLKLLKDRIVSMENLINGLLEYSKATKQDIKYTLVDINQCVEEIKSLLYITPEITVEVVSDLPKVYGIKTKLFQVFFNIIENAIKYNDKDNILVQISSKLNKNFIDYYITDNGPGIKEEYHSKIFKMFQTIEAPDKDSTGIGLSLAKKITEMHKGKIKLISNQYQGCTFVISLPNGH